MRLHVASYGSGSSTVALLHGLSGSHQIFHDLIGRLTNHDCTVLGVDLRGHGKSARAGSYRIEDFAGDVIESLPRGLDAVAAHSFGARVLLAAVRELRPYRAVYLDPAWFIPETTHDSAFMRANVGEHPDGSVYSLDELRALNPAWGTGNLRRVLQAREQWDRAMLRSLANMAAKSPFQMEPADRPSMVLYGGDSALLRAARLELLRAAGYEVRIQLNAGHNLHVDDVNTTFRYLEGWLWA